jgi:hypothetical protein
MRRFSLIPVVLAACLASTVALAASDGVTATFSSLSAQSVAGDVAQNPMAHGGTRIQGTLRNLEPGVPYTALIHSSAGCTGATVEITSFVANPSGHATFDSVSQLLTEISSIAIQKVSDGSNLACAIP